MITGENNNSGHAIGQEEVAVASLLVEDVEKLRDRALDFVYSLQSIITLFVGCPSHKHFLRPGPGRSEI